MDNKRRSKYLIYKHKVHHKTNNNYTNYKWIINPKNLNRGDNTFQIDHIYSIRDGFKNNIPIYIMASPVNLCMLSYTNNTKKGCRSDFKLNELLKLSKQFRKETNNHKKFKNRR